MKGSERIAQILVESKAYRDLEKPVILTSGELGIYYINTERLLDDKGAWEKYGNNPGDMIDHAVGMAEENKLFGEVIDIVSECVLKLVPQGNNGELAIAGGQRRDWLFSGPVSRNLQAPHISLYKNGSSEIIYPEGNLEKVFDLEGYLVIHVGDLITTGSSSYKLEGGKEKGWIPMIRNLGGKINNSVAVVSRKQGGEERLAKLKPPVTVNAFVAIDEDFLGKNSKNPQRALAYQKNPRSWAENYLSQNGALELVNNFDPNGGEIDRAKKFLNLYGDHLDKVGRLEELSRAVHETYGANLNSLFARKVA